MSTGYELVCHDCKRVQTMFTRFAGGCVMGLGKGDELNTELAMEFVLTHCGHRLEVVSDNSAIGIPDDYIDETSQDTTGTKI